uniref:Uncharacterized protein n=1 Tax=Opuntia streptacantha TaxID=393608 RepID=A0A7C9A3U7_OPUST
MHTGYSKSMHLSNLSCINCSNFWFIFLSPFGEGAVSYIPGFFVKRLKIPNSRVKVPPPAVDVILLSFSSTPCLKFTDPKGIPVGVSKAGSIRLASSSAK